MQQWDDEAWRSNSLSQSVTVGSLIIVRMVVGQNLCGLLLAALLCLDGVFASNGGQRCWTTKTTNIFSDEVETAFSCPQPGDPDHFTNCCGPSWHRMCCPAPSKFNQFNSNSLLGAVQCGDGLADFPAVFFHICTFDVCHETQILTNTNTKSQPKMEIGSTNSNWKLFMIQHCELPPQSSLPS